MIQVDLSRKLINRTNFGDFILLSDNLHTNSTSHYVFLLPISLSSVKHMDFPNDMLCTYLYISATYISFASTFILCKTYCFNLLNCTFIQFSTVVFWTRTICFKSYIIVFTMLSFFWYILNVLYLLLHFKLLYIATKSSHNVF